MKKYKKDFIELALSQQVLRFGEFTLKSGRISPYFFNAGLFYTGEALSKLGIFYANSIVDSGLKPDTLFGPAYKGIPLVSAVSIALFNQYQLNLPWSFNRKEIKNHGEGGAIVGSPLEGKILLIDDVMTAGTAIRESMQLIERTSGQAIGVMVMLDRQERGLGTRSAMQEVAEDYRIETHSIISLDNLIEYLTQYPKYVEQLEAIVAYQKQYGV